MKVKELIKELQALPEEWRNYDLISSIGDEGNGYNRVDHKPAIRYIPKSEKSSYIFESVCSDDPDDLEYWAENHGLTVEEFKKKAYKVVLI